MTYNSEEKTIDMKRLIITCLKNWRVALIAALIGAVLAGGAFALTEPEVIDVQSVITANQEQIDRNESLVTAYTSVQENLSEQLIYLDYLNSYEEMLEDAIQLKDTVSSDAEMNLIAQISDLKEKIFSVETKIAELETSLEGYEQQLMEIIDSIEQTQSTATNSIVNDAEDAIAVLEQQNEKLKKLNKEMKPYPEEKSVNDAVKSVFIGFLAGVIVVLGTVAVKYVFNNKIDSSDSIKDSYHIPVLADIHTSNCKHHSWLDKLLVKWNGEVQLLDFDAEYVLIAAKLKAMCPEESAEILMCSTVDDEYTESLCVEIQKHLGSQITIKTIDNPVKNADAALAVKNALVVLVEKIYVSEYDAIGQIIEQLTLSKSQIIGCVLI